MNISEEIKVFRIIIGNLLDIEIDGGEPTGLLALRALCATAIHALKRGSFLTDGDIILLGKEFLSVLDEKEIIISKKNRDYFLGKNLKKKKRKDWKTEIVWKGAVAHEKRQPRDAY